MRKSFRLFLVLASMLLLAWAGAGCVTTSEQPAPTSQSFEGSRFHYGTIQFIQRTVSNGILRKGITEKTILLPEGVPDFTSFGPGVDQYPDDIVHQIMYPTKPGAKFSNYSHYAFFAWFHQGEFIPIGIYYTDIGADPGEMCWIYQRNVPGEASPEDMQALVSYYAEREKAVKQDQASKHGL